MWDELKNKAEQAVEFKRQADKAAEAGDIDRSKMLYALATGFANEVVFQLNAEEEIFEQDARRIRELNLPLNVMTMNERGWRKAMASPVREILVAGGFDVGSFTVTKLALARASAMLRAAHAKRNEMIHRHFESLVKTEISDGPKIESVPVPPSTAKLALHMLLPPKQRDAVIGDLIEDYPRKVEERGRRGADRWFWKQTAIAIALMFGNRLMTVAGIAAAVDFLRRITK